MDKIDIKYSNIPNVCFSLSNKDDKREVEFSKQRKERGFDDSELWSLRDTIANFIIPRLERFRDIEIIPYSDNDKEYLNDVEKVISTFKIITRDNGSYIVTDEENELVKEGLEIFSEIFMTLWF